MAGFFLGLAAAGAIIGALYWRWRRGVDADIAQGAEVTYARYKENEPEFVEGLTEAEFRAVYDRVERPRFPDYALGALLTFAAALPLSFGLLSAGLRLMDRMGATPDTDRTAERLLIRDGKLIFFSDAPPEAASYYLRDLAGFYYFFGVLVIWLVIVAFFMRRYHMRRPGYLRDEIIRAKAKE